MRRAPPHTDRRLAIAHHVVDRVRQRAGATFLDAEHIRNIIAEAYRRAVRAGCVETHYYPGQQRVPFAVLGCALYAVVAKDKTGWGRGGVAVVTVLTPEQVRAREEAVRLGQRFSDEPPTGAVQRSR